MRKQLGMCRAWFVSVLFCLATWISGAVFAAPVYDAVGVRGKGASAFFILDAGPTMMKNTLGGVSGYELKKQAFLHSINRLPEAMKFNVAVYDGAETHVLFNELVPASKANRQKVNDWLKPLNANSGSGKFGNGTLAEGGKKSEVDVWISTFDIRNKKGERPGKEMGGWFKPTMLGMQAQAGSVFLFTADWGPEYVEMHGRYDPKWQKSSAGKRWEKCYQKGLQMLKEDNENRLKKGQPPRALGTSPEAIMRAYFPDLEVPAEGVYVEYEGSDYPEGFLTIRDAGLSGNKKSKKTDISMNVILFMPRSGKKDHSPDRFQDLAKTCNGKVKLIKGDVLIKSYLKTR